MLDTPLVAKVLGSTVLSLILVLPCLDMACRMAGSFLQVPWPSLGSWILVMLS